MPKARHDASVTVRLTPEQRRVLDTAARVSGELMSDVVRDAAMQAARRIVAGVASPPKTSAE
jgi:uncharacterized protein (DUF1778 family)